VRGHLRERANTSGTGPVRKRSVERTNDGTLPTQTLAPSRGIYLPSLAERYQPLIGARATERLLQKARRLKGLKVLHVNSTRQGGGVAEILSSMTPLMQSLGIEADWLVIDGPPEFFALTKDIHNGLQGDPIQIPPEAKRLHRATAHANAAIAALERYDIILVHDPQPLPLVELRQNQRWIWCLPYRSLGP